MDKNNDTIKDGADLYKKFSALKFKEIELLLLRAETRGEKAFYRALLNLKLQSEQEKIVGESLL